MQQCFHARLSRLVSFQLSLQVLRADCVARDVVAAAALPPLPAAEGANSQPPPVCVDCGCASQVNVRLLSDLYLLFGHWIATCVAFARRSTG